MLLEKSGVSTEKVYLPESLQILTLKNILFSFMIDFRNQPLCTLHMTSWQKRILTYFCIILPNKSYENIKDIFLRFYRFKIFFSLAILISSLYSKA